MSNELQNTLLSKIHSGWQSNPATHQIIDGYAKYHAVLAISGGLFLVILLWLSVIFWVKFNKIPKDSWSKWSFEKKSYFCFGILFTFIALFLTLIVAANVSNATNPLPGFSGGISSITTLNYNAELHQAFNDWIVSDQNMPPPLVQQRIHHRRVFHVTRVIVSGILLVVFTTLSVRLWKTLIVRRNSGVSKWTLNESALLSAGIALVALALLMIIVVMANLQSAIVPISNTLQFG